jgi:hypothetical protein
VKWRGDVGHIYADTGRLGIQAEIGAFRRDQLPSDLPELGLGNPLRIWLGKDPTRDFSRSLYFDVPRRLRASPLILLWHDLTGERRRHNEDKVQYDVFGFDAF